MFHLYEFLLGVLVCIIVEAGMGDDASNVVAFGLSLLLLLGGALLAFFLLIVITIVETRAPLVIHVRQIGAARRQVHGKSLDVCEEKWCGGEGRKERQKAFQKIEQG